MIEVLRIGHRPARDARITTHVCLAARAFGADGIYIDTKDTALEDTVNRVVSRFGGDFHITTGVEPSRLLREYGREGGKGKVVHLTMYGLPVEECAEEIRKKANGDLLVVVGATKVPPWYYQRADWNVAVGSQPHSEVSAVAVFLLLLNGGMPPGKRFNGPMRVLPSAKGKKVAVYD